MILAVCCCVVYEITAYGGIRSPDAEIVFRTGEALVNHGSFAVDRGIEGWEGFGLARGLDGRQYSIFGPAQAVLAAPLIAAGQWLVGTACVNHTAFTPPTSHYVGNSLDAFVANEPPPNRDEHVVRYVAAQLNVLVTALGVVLFYLVVHRIAGNSLAAISTAIAYGFGTIAWPYSGTFFSEPLATTCALAAFYTLLRNDWRFGADPPAMKRTVLAGAWLGIATAAHITAVLFAPFFLLYACYPYLGSRPRRDAITAALGFAVGLGAFLALLGFYNWERFGHPLETGRGVDLKAAAQFGYGVFTNPLEGFSGLLVSPNKGLLLFCPIVLLAALAWPRLHRLHPFLSSTLVACVISRLLFVASRSDWHGGFSLGPRYLLMIVPYLCLPLVLLGKALLQHGRRGRLLLAVGVWVFACQQYYFSLGEVFSYYHLRAWDAVGRGVNIFAGNQIYWEWRHSPLTSLLEGFRGPFLLRQLSLSNQTLFLLGCALLGAATALVVFGLWSEDDAPRP